MKSNNKIKFFAIICSIFLFYCNESYSKENFFEKAKDLYDKKNYEDSKFLFQRNIVFHPKHAKSYLYLAKIYLEEENDKKEEKNLKTAFLLEPNDEEVIYMLININLKKSNFSKVEELREKFEIVCTSLCKKTSSIEKRLNEIQAKGDS